MKISIKIIAAFSIALLLVGCTPKVTVTKNKSTTGDLDKDVIIEEVVEKDEYDTDTLIQMTGLDLEMEEACGPLKIEYGQAYMRADDSKPTLLSFCHYDGDVSLESEQAHLMAALPDPETSDWKIEELEVGEVSHPARFLGTITAEDGRELAVIEKYPVNAAFGASSFEYVYFDKGLKTDLAMTKHTLHGDMAVKNNKVIVDDGSVTETFTYNGKQFSQDSKLNKLNNEAEVIIYYDKDGDALTFSQEGSLDVKPGDRISFRRKQPITLTNFQIRTKLKQEENNIDTFVVTEDSMGEIIEAGEYPYDNMASFTVGKQTNTVDFLTPDFFAQLEVGKMPGSNIQLTDSNKKIEKELGNPQETYQIENGVYLEYPTFTYVVPTPETGGELIYEIIRNLKGSEKVTGDDIEAAWGSPDEELEHSDGTSVWNYYTSSNFIVTVKFSGTNKDSHVMNFKLMPYGS